MPASRSDVGRFPLRGALRGSADAEDGQLGIGVDVVDVPRFADLLALRGSALGDRVFTAAELATCGGSPQRLAARFAAKEAAAKALGLGIGPVAWRDVEVGAGDRGAPVLRLHGEALRAAKTRGLDRWAVSLSHDAARAVALVVATGARRTVLQR